jgi:hypothetical protein
VETTVFELAFGAALPMRRAVSRAVQQVELLAILRTKVDGGVHTRFGADAVLTYGRTRTVPLDA